MRVPSRRRNPVIADIFNRLKYMDRRGSGFKKILSDYRSQPSYSKELEPIFYSDNDSFILVLKNVNYNSAKETNTGNHTKKTLENMKKIEAYLVEHDGAKSKDIAAAIGLSVQRTRAILADMENVTPAGNYANRRYWLEK